MLFMEKPSKRKMTPQEAGRLGGLARAASCPVERMREIAGMCGLKARANDRAKRKAQKGGISSSDAPDEGLEPSLVPVDPLGS